MHMMSSTFAGQDSRDVNSLHTVTELHSIHETCFEIPPGVLTLDSIDRGMSDPCPNSFNHFATKSGTPLLSVSNIIPHLVNGQQSTTHVCDSIWNEERRDLLETLLDQVDDTCGRWGCSRTVNNQIRKRLVGKTTHV